MDVIGADAAISLVNTGARFVGATTMNPATGSTVSVYAPEQADLAIISIIRPGGGMFAMRDDELLIAAGSQVTSGTIGYDTNANTNRNFTSGKFTFDGITLTFIGSSTYNGTAMNWGVAFFKC